MNQKRNNIVPFPLQNRFKPKDKNFIPAGYTFKPKDKNFIPTGYTFEKGLTVMHEQLGIGFIMSYEEADNHESITVNFGRHGYKRMLLA